MKRNTKFKLILALFFLISSIVIFYKFYDFYNIKFSQEPKYKTSYATKSENPVLISELKPNLIQKFDGEVVRLKETMIRTNKEGFRDEKDYTYEKPDITYRIVILGDSYSFGYGVEFNDSWPRLLEDLLESYGWLDFEVLNFAHPGYSTEQEVELFDVKAKKYDPDLIIIGYLSNDIVNTSLNLELASEYIKSLGITPNSPTEYIRARWEFDDKYHREISNNAEKYWGNVENPLRRLNNLSNSQVLIVAFPSPDEHMNRLNNLTLEYDWGLLDLNSIDFSKYRLHNLDHHPNEEGHRIIVQNIFKFIGSNEQAYDNAYNFYKKTGNFGLAASLCLNNEGCYMKFGHIAGEQLPDLARAKEMCETILGDNKEICHFSMAIVAGRFYYNNSSKVNEICNSLEMRYRSNCFNMAAWKFAEESKGDAGKQVEYCKSINNNYTGECFNGFGDEIGRLFTPDIEKINSICSKIASPYNHNCFRGSGFSFGTYFKDAPKEAILILNKVQPEGKEDFINGFSGNLIESYAHKVSEINSFVMGISDAEIRVQIAGGAGNSIGWYYSHDIPYAISECNNFKEDILVKACLKELAASIARQYNDRRKCDYFNGEAKSACLDPIS